MRLTGEQAKALADALTTAIPTHEELRQVVRHGLDQPLDVLALGRDLREVAGKLVEAAEALPDGVARLLAAAREARPADPGLIAVAQAFGLAPLIPAIGEPAGGLERAVDPSSALIDMPTWLSRAGRLETQICLIQLRGKPQGTGFLVGPDVVITNYHVIEPVIAGDASAADLTLVFDHKRSADGTVVNPGVSYALATTDWQIDASPFQPGEGADDSGPPPSTSQLDYALLRTARPAGTEPVGGKLGPPRGWIAPLAENYAFAAGDIVYVVQHPRGSPLKIAAGTVIGVNANQTRVTYLPTTDHGSSGSPVFNRAWDLVALHHRGSATYNQGVPIAAIRRLLIERGHEDVLGHPVPEPLPVPAPTARGGGIVAGAAPADEGAEGAVDDTLLELSFEELESLDDALRGAFDRSRLERLLAYRLGTSLADIAPGQATYPREMQAVIEWAMREGQVRRLVTQARAMNPGNPKLKGWAERNLSRGEGA
jgi:hypothetical protein